VSLPKKKVEMSTPLKIDVTHDVAFAPKSKTVSVAAFSAAVADVRSEQLRLTVDRPFNIALGGGKAEAEPARVRVVASNLDLTPIAAFLPEGVPVSLDKARLSSTLNLDIANAGNHLAISDDTVVTGLAVTIGETTLDDITVSTRLDGNITDLDKTEIASTNISIKQGGKELASLRASGSGSIKEQTGKVTIHENIVDLGAAADLPLVFGTFKLAETDLGDTRLTSSSQITIGPKHLFAATGSFALSKMQFGSTGMKIDKLRPLDISGTHDVEFNSSSQTLSLRGADVKIADRGQQALQLTLQEPGNIMLAKGARTDTPLNLRSKITDLGLSLIKPFVKTDAVNLDTTTVNSDIVVEVALPFNIRAAGTLAASGIRLKDAPKPLAVSTDLDVRHNGKETITVTKLNAEFGAVGDSAVADAQVSGTVVLPLDKLGTELNVKTTKIVDVDDVLALLPQTAESADSPEPAEPAKPPTVAPFEPLWAKLNYDLAGIGYGEIGLIGIKGTAELAGNAYSLKSASALNSGRVTLDAKGEIPSVQDLTYDVKATLNNLDVKPVMQTVMPESAELIEGSIAESTLTVTGKGTNPDTILDELKVNAVVKTGEMSIGKSGTGWDTVFTVILLAQHQMGWQDMRFDHGTAELALADHLLTIKQIDVRGPLLRLSMGGKYDLKEKTPGFRIGLGYKGELAKYGDIEHESGYMMEESEWEITSFSKSEITAANVHKVAGLAGADAETQGDIKDGVEGVKTVKDVFTGKKSFTDGLLGGLKIYTERERREQERERREAEEENEEDGIKSVPPADFDGDDKEEKEEPPKRSVEEEIINDVFKNIFGK
jgi:hypothetical protein